jgi:hypothetical protein
MTSIRSQVRRALLALWLGSGASVGLVVAGDLGAETLAPAGAPAPPPTSVRDSPGWYPVVDPESTSVLLGRRLNAPPVREPFQGGAHSLDDLGRAVCQTLHHNDLESLRALCIREDEFRDILWREFPQSRPVTGLTWQDAWTILYARLSSGCSGAVGDFGGHYLEFLRFERTGGVKRFKNFRLHNGLVLVARSDTGEIERFTWLRSVAERKGVFKIYSVTD